MAALLHTIVEGFERYNSKAHPASCEFDLRSRMLAKRPRQPAARKRVITFASPRQSRPIPPPEFAIGYVLILMFRPTPHGDHGEGDQRQHIEPRNISQEVPLVRKTFVILAVAATIGGAALSPTDAFARWGGVGWGGVGFVGAPIFAYGVSCWRWAPTVWGPARVWVC